MAVYLTRETNEAIVIEAVEYLNLKKQTIRFLSGYHMKLSTEDFEAVLSKKKESGNGSIR